MLLLDGRDEWNEAAYHVVDGIIDSFDDLYLPFVLLFGSVMHVIDVHSSIIEGRAKPF